MVGELGAVVEGDAAAPVGWHLDQDVGQGLGDGSGGFSGWPGGDDEAGVALVEGEDHLFADAEHHQVGFPVAGTLAMGNLLGALGQRATQLDERGWATAPATSVAPFGLGPRQVMSPGICLIAPDLGVDEAVDALVGDDPAASFPGQPARHLLWRPALGQAGQHRLPQPLIPLQPATIPTPGPRLLLGIAGLIPLGPRPVALQLPSDR